MPQGASGYVMQRANRSSGTLKHATRLAAPRGYTRVSVTLHSDTDCQ